MMQKNNLFLFLILCLTLAWSSCEKENLSSIDNSEPEPVAPQFDSITGLNQEGTLVMDFRTNLSYKVVQIGDQYWMAQNLRSFVPNALTYPYTDSKDYGLLYPWDALMDGMAPSNSNPSGVQGLCPNGWHIPSLLEWVAFIDSVSHGGFLSEQQVAQSLKATTGWYSYTDYSGAFVETKGTNSSGFNVLGAGYARPNFQAPPSFHNKEVTATFWSTSECSPTCANAVEIRADAQILYRSVDKERAYSCRCVMD